MTWYSKGKVADGPEGLLHSARVYKGSVCAVYCVVTSESEKYRVLAVSVTTYKGSVGAVCNTNIGIKKIKDK